MHPLETQSGKKILTKIAKAYGLAKLNIISKITVGVLTHNFIVSDSPVTYFLREHREDDANRIKTIQKAEEFFGSGGIPVILPLKTLDKKGFVQYKNKFYSLFPFVKGISYKRTTVTPKAIRSAGRLLAKLHLMTKHNLPKIRFTKPKIKTSQNFTKSAAKIRKIISAKRKSDDFDREVLYLLALQEKLLAQNKINGTKLKLGQDHLTHGDYKLGNMFFDENDQVKYLYDTEKTAIVPRSREVARSLDLICFITGFEAKDFQKARTYLKAYQSVYPINPREVADAIRFYYLRYIGSLWVPDQYYNHKNKRVTHMIKRELTTIEYLGEHLDDYIKKVTSYITVELSDAVTAPTR